MTSRFKLYFRMPTDKKITFSPHAFIYLGDHSIDENGRHHIMPEFTESELDPQIDYLISELEEIRRIAKRKFQQAKKIFD